MKKLILQTLSFITFVTSLFGTTPYPVGELGEKWDFPSDHLPVGATVNELHIACWNILNTKYLNHIEKNTQGLKNSLILKTNTPDPSNPNLTKRDTLVVKDILEMLTHPTHPRSLLALEEVSPSVFTTLQDALPEHMALVPNHLSALKHGDIFIYDTNHFTFLDVHTTHYKTHLSNTYMTLSLKDKNTQTTYHFVQSHVPGGPTNSIPARKELANALMDTFDPAAITFVMGDMNASPELFQEAFNNAAEQRGLPKNLFKPLAIPYPTHINTKMEASWIDHLFIAAPFQRPHLTISDQGTLFFQSLQPTIDLLKNKQIIETQQ